MGFTYRNPVRSTDPQQAVAGAKSIIAAARPYRFRDEPERPAGAPGAGRPLRLGRPLRPAARRACARSRCGSGAPGTRRSCSPTTTRSSTARSPTAPGSAGSARTPTSCCRGRAAASCSAASSPTAEYRRPASRCADGCGTCRRCLDGCPTGAIVAPGVVDANRCLAWLVQKPGTFPVEFREALGDRLYGCDDCQEVCPPAERLGSRHRIDAQAHGAPTRPPQAWVDVLDLLDADRRAADRAPRPLVPRRPRAGLVAPQRARSCSATSATRRDPRGAALPRARAICRARRCGDAELGSRERRRTAARRARDWRRRDA